MVIDITEITGYLAAIVGTSLMLPQVYKIYLTKRVNDLSMYMILMYILNCILWLMYGILLQSLPMILCNGISLIIALIQLYLKLKYSKAIN